MEGRKKERKRVREREETGIYIHLGRVNKRWAQEWRRRSMMQEKHREKTQSRESKSKRRGRDGVTLQLTRAGRNRHGRREADPCLAQTEKTREKGETDNTQDPCVSHKTDTRARNATQAPCFHTSQTHT